jgi:ATP-dependent DNA ligase
MPQSGRRPPHHSRRSNHLAATSAITLNADTKVSHIERSDRNCFRFIRKIQQKKAERSLTKKMRNNRISLPKAMEARAVSEIPRGRQWQYEPKWDGFRCLLSRSQDAAAMRSKSGQDLGRYFPEIAAAAVTLPERDYILDGELVIPTARGFSFGDLLQRIHPA